MSIEHTRAPSMLYPHRICWSPLWFDDLPVRGVPSATRTVTPDRAAQGWWAPTTADIDVYSTDTILSRARRGAWFGQPLTDTDCHLRPPGWVLSKISSTPIPPIPPRPP